MYDGKCYSEFQSKPANVSLLLNTDGADLPVLAYGQFGRNYLPHYGMYTHFVYHLFMNWSALALLSADISKSTWFSEEPCTQVKKQLWTCLTTSIMGTKCWVELVHVVLGRLVLWSFIWCGAGGAPTSPWIPLAACLTIPTNCAHCTLMLWHSLLGVPVVTPAGPTTSPVILLVCSRAIVLNTKQWNGAHGSLYCKDKGTTVGGDHLYRYWPYCSSNERTHASLLYNAENAVMTGTAVSEVT